jgi:hypothetical protein
MLSVAPTPALAAWKFLGDVYTAHRHARDVLRYLEKHTHPQEDFLPKDLIQKIQYFQLQDTKLRLEFYQLTRLSQNFQSLQLAAYAVWGHALESDRPIPEMSVQETDTFLFPTPAANLLRQAIRYTPQGEELLEEAHGWLQYAIGTNPRQLGCADPILGPVRAIKLLLPTWMGKPYETSH